MRIEGEGKERGRRRGEKTIMQCVVEEEGKGEGKGRGRKGEGKGKERERKGNMEITVVLARIV